MIIYITPCDSVLTYMEITIVYSNTGKPFFLCHENLVGRSLNKVTNYLITLHRDNLEKKVRTHLLTHCFIVRTCLTTLDIKASP